MKVRPIESFGAPLMAALLKGALQGLEFQLPFRDAIRLRQRFHSLRSTMRETKHEKYPLVAKVRITIEQLAGTEMEHKGRHSYPKDRRAKVLMRLTPNDTEFEDVLQQAGVDSSLGTDTAPPITADDIQRSSDLEDMLKDL